MKITIDITPAELAELIFALVDCDVEIDDDEEEEFDEDAKTELVNQVVDVLIKNIKTTT